MQRVSRLLLLGVTALVAACSGSGSTTPTSPTVPTTITPPAAPSVSAFVAQNCSAADVATLVGQLLPQPLATTVTVLLNQLRLQASNAQRDKAQATALKIVDALLKNRASGMFATDPVKQQRLGKLIQLILCVVDLPQPAIDLTTAGGAAVITPTSPTTTIVTGDKLAGVTVPSGAVVQTTLVTVTPAATGVGPLLTDLDQYPLFYEFSVSPAAPFAQKVTVGICTAGNVATVFSRLRLAHNVGTNIGDIEVLPVAPAPFLDCSSLAMNGPASPLGSPFASIDAFKRWTKPFLAAALLPTEAFASTTMFKGCCLGGLAGSFSPFGAVDTASIIIDSVGASSFDGATGATVTPTVIAKKSADATSNPGAPARGIDVTFAVTSGGGTTTPLTARTGTDGKATTSWVLAAGANTLTASAVNGRASTAGGTTSAVLRSPLTFRALASTPSAFAYGAPGWRSLAISPTSAFDVSWASSSYYDAGWAVGQAAFGMPNPPNTECALYSQGPAPTQTYLPNTSIALRRRFVVPGGAASGVLAVVVDNDVKVYINGVALTAATDANGTPQVADANGYFVHEGCPTPDEFLFPLTGLSATDNTITVIAKDRGGSTYFDAAVRAVQPIQ